MVKFSVPFPDGQMNPLLRKHGFKEEDILEIRKILTDEIKRQNSQQENIMSNNS